MAWRASAVVLPRRLSGKASYQAAYSACSASSSATALCQRCGLARRSSGRRKRTRGGGSLAWRRAR